MDDSTASTEVVQKTLSNHPNAPKYLIFCPGCECCHGWNDTWEFNQNFNKPTVSPSLLVKYHDGKVCHSFIRDGIIQFLSDSTHQLAGQNHQLKPF